MNQEELLVKIREILARQGNLDAPWAKSLLKTAQSKNIDISEWNTFVYKVAEVSAAANDLKEVATLISEYLPPLTKGTGENSTQSESSKATAAYSVALGEGLVAKRESEAVFGKYNNPDEYADSLFTVGNGTEEDPSNAFVVHEDGRISAGAEGVEGRDLVQKQQLDALGVSISSDISKVEGRVEASESALFRHESAIDRLESAAVYLPTPGLNYVNGQCQGPIDRENFNETVLIIAPTDGDGTPTTSISSNAFANCKSLKYIEIPNTVQELGYDVFMGCEYVERVKIPFIGMSSSATGEQAKLGAMFALNKYEGENSNTSVPASLTDVVVTGGSVPEKAFDGCAYIVHVDLTQCDISIKQYAFRGCTSLTSVKLPESLLTIYSGAFANCTSLQQIDIPDLVSSIGVAAFRYCEQLRKVVLPDTLTSIGNFAFDDCLELQHITIPQAVTNMGIEVFTNCPNLTIYVKAPVIPTDWNAGWYGECPVYYAVYKDLNSSINTGLRNKVGGKGYKITGIVFEGDVVFRNGDTDVPSGDVLGYELRNATGLTSGMVYSVRLKTAAYECGEIERIDLTNNRVYVENAPQIKGFNSNPDDPENGFVANVLTIKGFPSIGDVDVGYGSFSTGSGNYVAERNGFSSGNGNHVLGCNGATFGQDNVVGYDALAWGKGNRALIDQSAVGGKYAKQSKDSLFTIGNGTVNKPSNALDVHQDGTVTVGSYPKKQADAVNAQSLQAYLGLSTIGTTGFDIELQNNGTAYISNGAGASGKVVIPGAYEGYPVQNIAKGCFQNNTAISEVNIQEGVQTIYANAFQNCRTLSNVQLPNTLVKIDYGAFQNTGLKSIDLPESLKSIHLNAFKGAPLTCTIRIPKSCRYVGYNHDGSGGDTGYVFNSTSIPAIVFEGTPIKISPNAFLKCECNIYVPWSEGQVAKPEGSAWGSKGSVIYNYSPAVLSADLDAAVKDLNAVDTAFAERISTLEDKVNQWSADGSVDIVQETGTSTTAVMSQKAVSDNLRGLSSRISNVESDTSDIKESVSSVGIDVASLEHGLITGTVVPKKAESANTATKAAQDDQGRNIAGSYALTLDLTNGDTIAKYATCIKTDYIDLLKNIFAVSASITSTSDSPFEKKVYTTDTVLHNSKGFYSIRVRLDVGAPYLVRYSTLQYIDLKSEDSHTFTIDGGNTYMQLRFSDVNGSTTLRVTTTRQSVTVYSIYMSYLATDTLFVE